MTEVRRLSYELTFLAAEQREVEADRATLSHYEELARARYASGVGIGQGVVKIQAEITGDDARLLEIATRRSALSARLNALRDRPQGTPIPAIMIRTATAPDLDPAELRAEALRRRPELVEADALIVRAERQGDSAAKGTRRISPPESNMRTSPSAATRWVGNSLPRTTDRMCWVCLPPSTCRSTARA